MIVTIVCVCGQHNPVRDEELECCHCVRCGVALLQPLSLVAASRVAVPTVVPALCSVH